MAEFALKVAGFSLQSEGHWKRVDDNADDTRTELWGVYAQAGYFFHAAIPAIPQPLEIAARFAMVDSDRAAPGNRVYEGTVGVNWFFAGHRNKLTADVSTIREERPDPDQTEEWRGRLQWDVSF